MNKSLLGRKYARDDRDRNYLIKNSGLLSATSATSKYWNDEEWWGNQGDSPKCVGYAWAHWIEDGPVTHAGKAPILSPDTIYSLAQKLDEWPGENYDGTSVRGGVKAVQSKGYVQSYLWAYDLKTLINTVLTMGPVVVGTNWYEGMFYPDANGLIKVTGRVAGGHCYVINGVDTVKKLFRIKNSWGREWGVNGRAYIRFSDMEQLIKRSGEVCLAVEKA